MSSNWESPPTPTHPREDRLRKRRDKRQGETVKKRLVRIRAEGRESIWPAVAFANMHSQGGEKGGCEKERSPQVFAHASWTMQNCSDSHADLSGQVEQSANQPPHDFISSPPVAPDETAISPHREARVREREKTALPLRRGNGREKLMCTDEDTTLKQSSSKSQGRKEPSGRAALSCLVLPADHLAGRGRFCKRHSRIHVVAPSRPSDRVGEGWDASMALDGSPGRLSPPSKAGKMVPADWIPSTGLRRAGNLSWVRRQTASDVAQYREPHIHWRMGRRYTRGGEMVLAPGGRKPLTCPD